MDNILKIKLYQLPKGLKLLLLLTVLNLMVGVGVGLYYVANTTHLSLEGTSEQFRGSILEDEFDIPENDIKSSFSTKLKIYPPFFLISICTDVFLLCNCFSSGIINSVLPV